MARGSHNFTCHPNVYSRLEWAILHAFRKHSPDGVAPARWRTSGSAYYSSMDPEKMKGWVGRVGWPYSGWFTHISGHPSVTGQAWGTERSPVKDRRSTTKSRSQPGGSEIRTPPAMSDHSDLRFSQIRWYIYELVVHHCCGFVLTLLWKFCSEIS